MWLPTLNESLLFMKDESIVNLSYLNNIIITNLELNKWHIKFKSLYHKWLEEDSTEIYDINNEINIQIIKKIETLNMNLENIKFFYWFDVDRSNDCNKDFLWQKCPLSNLPLIKLPENHPNNRYISPKFPIVFPELNNI